jgi:hypothetical protein
MSRLSALFTARKRPEAPPVAAASARSPSSNFNVPPQGSLEDNVFSLVPPEKMAEASQETSQQTTQQTTQQTSQETSQEWSEETPKDTDSPAEKVAGDADPAPPKKSSSNLHQLATADLSRLAIDNDGKLYWDGKPVEVRRRLSLSPEQTLAASIVAVFLVIGAIGAAAQGSLALRDWGCRLGWTANYCVLPDKAPPRLDIPA